jgi:hypothetical protein
LTLSLCIMCNHEERYIGRIKVWWELCCR